MYVWMILATFIVMLTAFNLSPRTDMQQQQDAPLAEAAVTKFLVQHDAAVKYIEKIRETYHNNPGNASKILTIGDHIITGCNDSSGNLCPYLPVGFKYEENLYNSSYWCLNGEEGKVENNARTISKYEGTSLGTSCMETITGEGTSRKTNSIFVITYGRVPERWKNVSSHAILASYYNAMHKLVAVGASCGIVRPKRDNDTHTYIYTYVDENGNEHKEQRTYDRNTMQSDFIIEGIDVKNNSIPPYFLSNDSKFKEKCLNGKNVNPDYPCIIYVTNL